MIVASRKQLQCKVKRHMRDNARVTNVDAEAATLTAAEAAQVASQTAGKHISAPAFRSAVRRSKDPTVQPVIQDGQLLWRKTAAQAVGAAQSRHKAEEWGAKHGFMTAFQAAAAADMSVGAFRRAMVSPTLSNPPPDPLSPQETEHLIPSEFRRWVWYRAQQVEEWKQRRPDRGNRLPKRVTADKLGSHEWTARACADAAGCDDVYQWHRHCRTTPDAPRPHRTEGSTFLWHREEVETYLKRIGGRLR
ncbi:hypothetical protein [Nocardia asiatica]|uniref:hypothetical protein n=1 Tax=Nocardia asiatica TaxID=209252 RepID=UPI0012FB15E2|nr:hypothetical protein [Nocardia asiatica]